MLSHTSWRRSLFIIGVPLSVIASVAAALLLHQHRDQASNPGSEYPAPALRPTVRARDIALIPHAGTEPLDLQIRALQKRIAESTDSDLLFERLGGLFISKARLSNDPGFYKLAEQSALALENGQPGHPDALLLRGHALAAMHQFREAETLARRLVASREYVLDHALLGDALMEQGRLDEAVAAYQRMVDLKPGLQSYTRIAHLRWLKGDVEGAAEMMELAVAAGTPRIPEAVAWATTRLAAYRLQSGDFETAHRLCSRALQLVPGYAPALLMQGRVLVAEGKPAEAAEPLQLAAVRNPLPEVQWLLADTLRAAGQLESAAAVEAQLGARGAGADPRSFSLYLSTRGTRPADALRHAQKEMENRRDVFSYDALAWAQHANGQGAEALANMKAALREGTQDARLFLHAGIISAAEGLPQEARSHLVRADLLRAMLFPSERALLEHHLAILTPSADGRPLTSITTQQ
jgi:tetratricopeptide (TPR) repeat protein